MKRYPYVIVYCGREATMFENLDKVIENIKQENENYVLKINRNKNTKDMLDYYCDNKKYYLVFENKTIEEIESELKDFLTLKEII